MWRNTPGYLQQRKLSLFWLKMVDATHPQPSTKIKIPQNNSTTYIYYHKHCMCVTRNSFSSQFLEHHDANAEVPILQWKHCRITLDRCSGRVFLEQQQRNQEKKCTTPKCTQFYEPFRLQNGQVYKASHNINVNICKQTPECDPKESSRTKQNSSTSFLFFACKPSVNNRNVSQQ